MWFIEHPYAYSMYALRGEGGWILDIFHMYGVCNGGGFENRPMGPSINDVT